MSVGGFQTRLLQLRRDMRLNQTEFGRQMGVSKATQVAYELGQTIPNVDYLAALPNSVDLNRLVRGTPAASIDWETLITIAKAITDANAGNVALPVEKLLVAVRRVYEASVSPPQPSEPRSTG